MTQPTFQLTRPQRDMLIQHMDGRGVPPLHRDSGGRYHTMCSLLARSMIKSDHRRKPPLTYITDKGREALAGALADWADALEKAGFEIEDRGNVVNAAFAQVFHNLPRTQAEHPAEESAA
jgi:hypothetical protein